MKLLTTLILILTVLCIGCKKDSEEVISPEERRVIHPDTGNGVWRSFNIGNSGIPENWVYDVAVDSKNNYWVGTAGHGIGKYDGNKWTTYNTRNSGLLNDDIKSITVDSKDNIWIGTGSGIQRFGSDNTWTNYTQSNTILPSGAARSLEVDKNGVLWIGIGSLGKGGLLSFDGMNWKFFTPENSKLPGTLVWDIAIDKYNNKVIGLHFCQDKGGLVIIDNDNNWKVYDNTNSIITFNGIDMVSIDKDNHIWAGTNAFEYENKGGLYEFDGSNSWTDCNPYLSGKLYWKVTALTNDQNGLTWVATTGGAYKFYQELSIFYNSKWYLMSELFKDFPRLAIDKLIVDKHNRILAITTKGLYVINLDPALLK